MGGMAAAGLSISSLVGRAALLDASLDTAESVGESWKSLDIKALGGAIPFYDYNPGADHAYLNNWFHHEPFFFEVPSLMLPDGFLSPVPCKTAEKAIMLCKAAVMSDRESYDAMVATDDPAELQTLGRNVKPYDRELWRAVVCSVAFEAVHQKFSNLPQLAEQLLSTQARILVETSPTDKIWGIGIGPDCGEEVYGDPARWNGTNIAGWA